MQDGEIKEIGEIVFGGEKNNSISGIVISDKMFPLEKYLTYLFNSKLIIDLYYNKIWSFSEFKRHIKDLIDEEYEYQKQLTKLRNKFIDENTLNEQTDAFMESSRESSNNRIKDAEKKIARLSIDISKYKNVNIEEIKKIPISNFIEFNSGGKCRCVWPDHNDKTPSMKYYPETNTVNCFGCHHAGDVIDVVMAVHNTDFKGAIKILQNGQNN